MASFCTGVLSSHQAHNLQQHSEHPGSAALRIEQTGAALIDLTDKEFGREK